MPNIITKSLLTNRGVIEVSGSDAREFLQGLITNDIHKITPGTAVFAALLSPQGKFLYDFFIIENDGKLLIDIDKSQIPELIKRLSMYKLRSHVEIAEMPELKVTAEWGSAVEKLPGIIFQDPRLPDLGERVIGSDVSAADNGAYETHRLSLAVPEGIKDLIKDRSLPMEWGYDKLNAIDFNKGCYVGQEVTARSKHRATLHKMVHQIRADEPLPMSGTIIKSDSREVGITASSVENNGVAMLNLDVVKSGAKLFAAEVEIHARIPDWAQSKNQE